MHFLMSGIIRSTGSLHVFSTSVIMFLYPAICRKQAWRDSQPKVFKNRRKMRLEENEEKWDLFFGIHSLDVCAIELFEFI